MPEKIETIEGSEPPEINRDDYYRLPDEEKKEYHEGLGPDGKYHFYRKTPELLEEEEDVWGVGS